MLDHPRQFKTQSRSVLELIGNTPLLSFRRVTRNLRNVEVYGAVKNLFDRLPPYDPQTYGAVNFNPTFHLAGAIGRFFSVGARYTW